MQNPNHTFSQNGTFNVCLTATNSIGSDKVCKTFTVTNYLPPISGFNFNIQFNTKNVTFTDISTNSPNWWRWDFDDAGATSTQENPMHTFGTWGAHDVCLTTANFVAGQGDTACQIVDIVFNSIDETEEYGTLKAYPNPSSTIANIELPNVVSLEKIRFFVTNLKGEQIVADYNLDQGNIQLNAKEMPRGLYLYKVYESQKLITSGQLIVQ